MKIFAPAYCRRSIIEQSDGFEVHRSASLPALVYKDLQLTLPKWSEIMKLVEEFDPDIIHVHTPGTVGLVGLLIARNKHKPIVGTYHTLYSETLIYVSPKRLFAWMDKLGSENLGNGVIHGFSEGLKKFHLLDSSDKEEKKETMGQRLTWFVINQFYKYCDLVIAPSAAIKRELDNRGLKGMTKVVSNGIDISNFGSKTDYVASQKIIYVGRLGFEKNVDVVVRGFEKVVKEIPQARLTVVGDGPALSSLQSLVKERGLNEKVEFLGHMQRDRLGEIYRSADVFVTASTMETQGLVLLEAMACGLPAVGANKYAIPDMIKHGVNGYLFSPGDVKEAAKYLVGILKNEKLRQRMGKAARTTAEKHDVNLTVLQMESAYIQAIIKHNKKKGIRTRLANWFKV